MASRLLFLCALGSSRAFLAASVLESLAEGQYDTWSTPPGDEQECILVHEKQSLLHNEVLAASLRQ